MLMAVVFHAITNASVDVVLALLLMIGGVIGAQFGARTSLSMKGEELRLLLGLVVLAVGVRFLIDLVVQPDDPFSNTIVEWVGPHMSRLGAILVLLLTAGIARAETMITSLSTHRLQITSNFVGSQIVLFGAIERDAQTISRAGGYDLAVVVRGPRRGS